MPSQTFVLAHLSDVHLPSMPRLPLSAINLKRVLGRVNWHRNRRHVHVRSVLDAIVADVAAHKPDHIAVTGDLVNLGLPREHEMALDWLTALGKPGDVSVVPGNHDSYVNLRADPGYRRWHAYMQGEAAQAVVSGASGIAPHFPYLRRIGPLALIGLGSGVPTPPFVSAGHLGPRQVADLAALLETAGRAGLVRVVAIHHPPHRYHDEWRTGLKDAGPLEEVLKAAGAEMVLHGHFHRAQLRWIEGAGGRVPIIGVPSASAAIRHKGDLAGYSLLVITRVGEGRHGIELIRRGFAEPGGAIVELERVVLAKAG